MSTPSRISAELRLIAARIDRSEKPSQALVTRDLRSVLAAMDPKPDMVPIFVGVSFPPGTPQDEAVRRMKALIEADGYATGDFVLGQDLGDGIVGNLDIEESFWDDHGEDGWEGSDDLIQVNVEVP